MDGQISSDTPVYVRRVTADGLGRTSDQFMKDQTRCIRDVNNWGELKSAIHKVTNNLYKFDIFEQVVPTIDIADHTSKDANDCYVVHFSVKEKNWRKLSVQAAVDMNNKVDLELSGRIMNCRGRADSLIGQFQKGIYGGQLGKLAYRSPITTSADEVGEIGIQAELLDYDWANINESNHSVYASLECMSRFGSHLLRCGPIWRSVIPSGSAPVGSREFAHETLKINLRHVFERDTRDNVVFPRIGSHLRSITDFCVVPADWGGAAVQPNFIKHEIESSTVLPLPALLRWYGLSMVATFGCGMGYGFGKNIFLTDRFFLGGPLNLRGFKMRSVGPTSTDSPAMAGTPAGTEGFYLTGLHLYSPLPYFRENGFSRHLRLHSFVNYGNSCSDTGRLQDWWQPGRPLFDALLKNSRVSVGAGITMAVMGVARLELNYCMPWISHAGDQLAPGLHFGIGLNFL